MILKTLTKDEMNQSLGFLQDVIIQDGNLKSFKMYIGGQLFMFSHTDYYGIKVLMPEPDKVSQKYEVSGKIDGHEIKEKIFDDVHDAEDFVKKLDDGKIKEIHWNETHNFRLFEDTVTALNQQPSNIPF